VTGGANAIRVPVIHREVRVIERGSGPCCGGVASRTGGRESRRSVIRIGRAVVIRLVAAHARGRQCRVVVIHVAIGAGHGRVRPSQRERRRVVVERRSRPVRRAVAGITRVGEPHLRVVRILCVGVIRLMARYARSIRAGQIVVAVHVTRATGGRGMRPGQRESGGRVVEGPVTPVRRRMALVAGLREARLYVIGIGRALEVCQMALRACPARQLVIVVRMALRALQRRMGAGQSKSGCRVIERRGRPCRRVVALCASLREPRRGVRRIVGCVEVVLVATDARGIGGCQIVITIHVALHALQRSMRAREGEAGRRVIEGRITPSGRGVALLASLREACLHVIWVGRALEVLQVA